MESFAHTFLEKIDKDGPTSTYVIGKCWMWLAGTNQRYGIFSNDYAHRYSWKTYNGKEIPDGYEIDHLCFNTLCVNPNHLDCVTPQENKRRYFATITHCPSGHDYSIENTAMRGNSRYCKSCDRNSHRKKARANGVREIGSFRPWNAKLNENQVKEIRSKYIPRVYTQKQLAKEYGVAQTLISAIIQRKVWDDVP